jgi:hypothetical protein
MAGLLGTYGTANSFRVGNSQIRHLVHGWRYEYTDDENIKIYLSVCSGGKMPSTEPVVATVEAIFRAAVVHDVNKRMMDASDRASEFSGIFNRCMDQLVDNMSNFFSPDAMGRYNVAEGQNAAEERRTEMESIRTAQKAIIFSNIQAANSSETPRSDATELEVLFGELNVGSNIPIETRNAQDGLNGVSGATTNFRLFFKQFFVDGFDTQSDFGQLIRNWVSGDSTLKWMNTGNTGNVGRRFRLSTLMHEEKNRLQNNDDTFTDKIEQWEYDVHVTNGEARRAEAREFCLLVAAAMVGTDTENDRRREFERGESGNYTCETYTREVVVSASGKCSQMVWQPLMGLPGDGGARERLQSEFETLLQSAEPFRGTDPYAEATIKPVMDKLFAAYTTTIEAGGYQLRPIESAPSSLHADGSDVVLSFSTDMGYTWCFGATPSLHSLAIGLVARHATSLLSLTSTNDEDANSNTVTDSARDGEVYYDAPSDPEDNPVSLSSNALGDTLGDASRDIKRNTSATGPDTSSDGTEHRVQLRWDQFASSVTEAIGIEFKRALKMWDPKFTELLKSDDERTKQAVYNSPIHVTAIKGDSTPVGWAFGIGEGVECTFDLAKTRLKERVPDNSFTRQQTQDAWKPIIDDAKKYIMTNDFREILKSRVGIVPNISTCRMYTVGGVTDSTTVREITEELFNKTYNVDGAGFKINNASYIRFKLTIETVELMVSSKMIVVFQDETSIDKLRIENDNNDIHITKWFASIYRLEFPETMNDKDIRERFKEWYMKGIVCLPLPPQLHALGGNGNGNNDLNMPTVLGMQITMNMGRAAREIFEGFCGWHHSTVRALGRTEHAWVCGKHADAIRMAATPENKYYKKLQHGNSGNSKMETAYNLLVQLMQQHRDGGRELVVPMSVVVHGPSQNAIATRCAVDGIIRTTGYFELIISELWSHITGILQDRDLYVCGHSKQITLAGKLRAHFKVSKRSRTTDGDRVEFTFQWLVKQVVSFKNLALGQIILRTIIATEVHVSARSDGGRRYRQPLMIQESKTSLLNTINEMLYLTLND